MDLKDFVITQEITECKNPVKLNWNIAVDVGYSSVKGISPNKRFCFPSYVRKIEDGLLSADDNDIYYKDEDGTYLVGENAQALVRTDETNDTESFYGRNRYYSKEFLILARTAAAVGQMGNKERNPIPHGRIVVQTGLPAAYLKADAPMIRNAFTDSAGYSVRLGNGPWMKFENQLKTTDVYVMAQPAGTLYSIMTDDAGQYHENRKKLLSQNILIADIGFGTFDPYGLINRKLVTLESIDTLGMKRVFETASRDIYSDYKMDIRIPQMRKCIRNGYFTVTDIRKMTGKKIAVEPYILKASGKVAEEAAKKLYEIADYFKEYNILVITGGTGAAWYPFMKERFSGIDSLEIIPGNDGCGIPVHYANVRGYYMSALLRERKM